MNCRCSGNDSYMFNKLFLYSANDSYMFKKWFLYSANDFYFEQEIYIFINLKFILSNMRFISNSLRFTFNKMKFFQRKSFTCSKIIYIHAANKTYIQMDSVERKTWSVSCTSGL